jgi:hypothetical protein
VLVPGRPDVNRRAPSASDAAPFPDDGVEVKTSIFGPGVDAAVSGRADLVTWKTRSWRVLSPADQLVDICARLDEWDARSRLLPLVDAALVIRRRPGPDWDLVEALSARLGLTAALSRLLRTLEDAIGLRVPHAAVTPATAADGATP